MTSSGSFNSDVGFRRIVENSQPIIFAIDTDGKFILSEGKSLSSLGLKPGEVVGHSALEIYKDYPSIITGIHEALAGRTYQDVITVQGVSGDVSFDIFYSPLTNEQGVVEGLIGMAIDITEMVKSKKILQDKIVELEEANKLMVGREVRMVELKEEIAQLKKPGN